jgi:hypothetical protein
MMYTLINCPGHNKHPSPTANGASALNEGLHDFASDSPSAETLLGMARDLINFLRCEIEDLRQRLSTTEWALMWSQAEPQRGERTWWQ